MSNGATTSGGDFGERSLRAVEDFVAFIYAAGVSIIINNAHSNQLFNDTCLTLCVVCGIFFFAQDWLNRFGGVRRIHIHGVRTPKFYAKSILDVAVVVFLCLTILDAIDVMKDQREKCFLGLAMTNSFYCKLAVFALASGCWNIVVIFAFVKADLKLDKKNDNLSAFFFKGHVGDDILALFPRLQVKLMKMQDWIGELREKVVKSGEDIGKKEGTPMRHLVCVIQSFWDYYLWRHTLIGPVRLLPLIFTCWIGLHLLLLNVALGGLILLSTLKLDGHPLYTVVRDSWHMDWLFAVKLLAVVWISCMFRTAYFSSGKKKEWLETVGYWIFGVCLVFLYVALDVRQLFWALVFQQLAANIFIFIYFRVPTGNSQSTSNTAATTQDGAAPAAAQGRA